MKLALAGPSYSMRSRAAGVQRSVNLYPTPLESGNYHHGQGFVTVLDMLWYPDELKLPRDAGEGDYYWLPRAGLAGMYAGGM